MNYVNTEKYKSMKQITKYVTVFIFMLPCAALAQEVLPLDSIFGRIERNNVLLQSYELKAAGYKYSADAATAWMAPMGGIGTFITPYPGEKLMDTRERGNVMVTFEQQIPNLFFGPFPHGRVVLP